MDAMDSTEPVPAGTADTTDLQTAEPQQQLQDPLPMGTRKRRLSHSNGTDADTTADEQSARLNKVARKLDESSLLSLSDEILLEIMVHLDSASLEAMAATCYRLRSVVEDPRLWNVFDFRHKRLLSDQVTQRFRHLTEKTRSFHVRGHADNRAAPHYDDVTLTRAMLLKLRTLCPQLRQMSLMNSFLDSPSDAPLSIYDFPETLHVFNMRHVNTHTPMLSRTFFTRIDSHMSHLHTIRFEYCPWFHTHNLIVFSKLEHLRHLSLRGCSTMRDCVPYGSVSTRFGFKKLRTLDLRDTPVADSDIQCFNVTRTLRKLYLQAPAKPPKSARLPAAVAAAAASTAAGDANTAGKPAASTERVCRCNSSADSTTTTTAPSAGSSQAGTSSALVPTEADRYPLTVHFPNGDKGRPVTVRTLAPIYVRSWETRSAPRTRSNSAKKTDSSSQTAAGPSAAPTVGPSAEPIAGPSAAPTAGPSAEPTAGPSAEPIAGPSAEPIAGPSAEPIAGASSESTAGPSAEPTAGPSSEPTAGPSAAPTAGSSSDPSAEPTAGPASAPTADARTDKSSSELTAGPSAKPTDGSSAEPTAGPTSAPTAGASSEPTAGPSAEPTAGPSRARRCCRCKGQLATSAEYEGFAAESELLGPRRHVNVQHRQYIGVVVQGVNIDNYVLNPYEVPDVRVIRDASPQPRLIVMRGMATDDEHQHNLIAGELMDRNRFIAQQTARLFQPTDLITDRGVCAFGESNTNVRGGLIWIRCEARPRDTMLEVLSLRGYRGITDMTLQHLAECAPLLLYLDVRETSVTPHGVLEFRAAKPNCVVLFSVAAAASQPDDKPATAQPVSKSAKKTKVGSKKTPQKRTSDGGSGAEANGKLRCSPADAAAEELASAEPAIEQVSEVVAGDATANAVAGGSGEAASVAAGDSGEAASVAAGDIGETLGTVTGAVVSHDAANAASDNDGGLDGKCIPNRASQKDIAMDDSCDSD